MGTYGHCDGYKMLHWTRGTFACAAGQGKVHLVRVSLQRKAEVCRKVPYVR